ncbi:flavin reductase family protein [Ferroglobus sp.]|uniref:flavin reductase family protein n=1 Tax=Ferroglobus sp. TaxID=2614230 RepID=UPI0025B833E6|nr:flavin reductase family protein [Ferroglobus sp.]
MKVKIKEAYRLLHPRPVVLVCSSYEGKTSFMACSWVTPVNDEPAMLAAAIWEENFTHELIEKSNEFTVNVPSVDIAEKVWLAGKKSGRSVDKAKLTGLKLGKAKKVSAPIIEDCVANLECVVKDKAKAGDHTVFIAEIVEAYAEKDLFEKVWKEDAKILMHVGGKVFSTSSNFFEVR